MCVCVSEFQLLMDLVYFSEHVPEHFVLGLDACGQFQHGYVDSIVPLSCTGVSVCLSTDISYISVDFDPLNGLRTAFFLVLMLRKGSWVGKRIKRLVLFLK